MHQAVRERQLYTERVGESQTDMAFGRWTFGQPARQHQHGKSCRWQLPDINLSVTSQRCIVCH